MEDIKMMKICELYDCRPICPECFQRHLLPKDTLKLVHASPGLNDIPNAYMHEKLEFSVWIKGKKIDPRFIMVHVWTNIVDSINSNFEYHEVPLQFAGICNGLLEFSGHSVVLGDGDFFFTYRARMREDKTWAVMEGDHGTGLGHRPRGRDKWVRELRDTVDDYTWIIGPLHLGNERAAINAKRNGFTHVMCVAEELQKPFLNQDIVFHRVPMSYGVQHELSKDFVREAVAWIKGNWKVPGCKILVYCRVGFGRAGSTVLSLVFAQFNEMSYDEAVNFMYCKRPIFQHRGLRNTLEELYPRPRDW